MAIGLNPGKTDCVNGVSQADVCFCGYVPNDATCIGEELPNQCFQFGMERLNTSTGEIIAAPSPPVGSKDRLDTEQCKKACCADSTCNSYQEMRNRGCYFGVSDCKRGTVDGEYNGGRKCLRKFCGGQEDAILGRPSRYR